MTGLIAGFICLYGMVLTSFFDVLATRIPKHESILGRSHCDACNKELHWVDIIPVFGYIWNKGRCRYCQKPISIYHPLIEILGGILFLVSYLQYEFSFSFWISIIMISVLLIESITDSHYRIVMDRIWLLGIIPLIIIRIIEGTWLTHVISSVSLFVGLYILASITKRITHKESLGGGDIKLYLFIGWVLDVTLGFMSLFLASILGLVFMMVRKKTEDPYIPMVPFISIGVWLAFHFGPSIIDYYLSLLRM